MSLTDFEVLEKLGEGSFSTVYKVRRVSDLQIYALKRARFQPLKPKEKDNALNEVRILASICSPNVIQYKEAFFSPEHRDLCIVMEYAEHGDLFKQINEHKKNNTRFEEFEIWSALVQITRGLLALHDLNIMHRDLKCANIFVGANFQYKLGDLNVSKVSKQAFAHTQTGTPYYASPEVWKDQPYNSSSDIWSLGCVLYEMATLAPPFTAGSMQELYRKVIRGVYPSLPQFYSTDLSNVIRSMLQVNYTLRPTCQQILQMSAVQRHIAVEPYAKEGAALLGTIKMSYNLSAVKNQLPAARYKSSGRIDYRKLGHKEVMSAAYIKPKLDEPMHKPADLPRPGLPRPHEARRHRPPAVHRLHKLHPHPCFMIDRGRNHSIDRLNSSKSRHNIGSGRELARAASRDAANRIHRVAPLVLDNNNYHLKKQEW